MIPVINVGVTENMPRSQSRAIILSNTISVISAFFTAVYLLYIFLLAPWSFVHQVLLVAFVVLCAIPLLNYLHIIHLSRVLLTMVLPLASLIVMMLYRMQNPDAFSYQRSPGIYAVLLATSVVPVLIFSRREKKSMYFCLIFNFLLFTLLDVGLRYYSNLHEIPTVSQYLGANLALIITYLLLQTSVMSLKQLVDEFEEKNTKLIEDLHLKNSVLENYNRELHELNKNVETQNEEIQAQSEELMQSQESLILANNEIERQKSELELQNKFLEKSLDEKSKDLLHTNQQLVMQNNDLQQFSYTVSHNMRGPVASMIGLMNIHHMAETPEERQYIFQLIEQSAYSLETIIRDLNKIIDIRNDRFSAFEEVEFDAELKLIRLSLKSFIQDNDVQIETDFRHTSIISIKAYVNSILYNLVSNAIQYRSPERQPQVRISTFLENGYTVLDVSDNGLGIDLTRYEGDLFKLYKRFHTHTQGKGLGLYLVKQQVEKLNGTIRVKSQLDTGTTFSVLLPVKN